jgi:hypothetical protein
MLKLLKRERGEKLKDFIKVNSYKKQKAAEL